jgi:membrane protein implicated in regulation of membrane protease activity
MNRIAEHLSDPSWWFTIIFGTVIVCITEIFLKDILLSAMAKVSATYKSRKQKLDKEIEDEVRKMLSDPFLFVLTFCNYIFQTCISIAFIVIYSVNAFLFITLPKEADLSTKRIISVLAVFTGGTVIYSILRDKPRRQVIKKAYLRYRKKVTENVAQQSAPCDSERNVDTPSGTPEP